MRENLTNLIKSYGFYLWPILTLLVVSFIFLRIDLPKVNEIMAIRQKLAGSQEELAKLRAKSNLLTSLDETKLREDLEKISLVLPDGKDVPSILRNLENSASLSGVMIENLDLVPGKIATFSVTAETSEIPVKVTINGTTSQISDFLGKSMTRGRAMGLRSLDLTFPQGLSSVNAQLELVAYFLFPQEQTPKVEEPLVAWGDQENAILAKILQRELLPPLLLPSPTGKTDIFR